MANQAILMVRESLVLGILGFLYAEVDHFCRWLHRYMSFSSFACCQVPIRVRILKSTVFSCHNLGVTLSFRVSHML